MIYQDSRYLVEIAGADPSFEQELRGVWCRVDLWYSELAEDSEILAWRVTDRLKNVSYGQEWTRLGWSVVADTPRRFARYMRDCVGWQDVRMKWAKGFALDSPFPERGRVTPRMRGASGE